MVILSIHEFNANMLVYRLLYVQYIIYLITFLELEIVVMEMRGNLKELSPPDRKNRNFTQQYFDV